MRVNVHTQRCTHSVCKSFSRDSVSGMVPLRPLPSSALAQAAGQSGAAAHRASVRHTATTHNTQNIVHAARARSGTHSDVTRLSLLHVTPKKVQ